MKNKLIFEEFSSKEKFWLDMTSSIQIRVFTLSSEVRYIFWVSMNSEKVAGDNYSQ